MKKYIMLMVTLLVTMFAGTSFAFTPPQPNGFVTDATGKLSSSERAALEDKCKKINAKTGNEIAVLVVPTLDGSNIEDAAQDTWRSWKVGKGGLDNGVLLMLAMKERKSRIQTGKGVEGDLPDLKTQDILINMRPYLRSDNLAGALNFGVDQIAATLESRKGQKVDTRVAPGATFDKRANPNVPMTVPTTDTTTTTSNHQGVQGCDASGVGFGMITPLLIISIPLIIGLFLLRRARRREEEAQRERLDAIARIRERQRILEDKIIERKKETLRFPTPNVLDYNVIDTAPAPKPYVAPAPYVAPKPAPKKRSSDSSSYSSNSSYSSGSSSSWDSGSGSSGGGFGGGDSGGGGSSSDW